MYVLMWVCQHTHTHTSMHTSCHCICVTLQLCGCSLLAVSSLLAICHLSFVSNAKFVCCRRLAFSLNLFSLTADKGKLPPPLPPPPPVECNGFELNSFVSCSLFTLNKLNLSVNVVCLSVCLFVSPNCFNDGFMFNNKRNNNKTTIDCEFYWIRFVGWCGEGYFYKQCEEGFYFWNL